jgi:hypothetical protein
VKCPKCKRDVHAVWGNGDFPNASYRCENCLDDETGQVVGGFVLLIFAIIGIVGAVAIAQEYFL